MTDYLAKNLAFLLRGDKATQGAVALLIGVTQPTISKWTRLEQKGSEPEFRKMAKLAQVLRVSMDDLMYRDLENDGPTPSSHPEQLDPIRLGLALTSFDKALRDMEIQGRIGTLVEPLQYAYLKAFKVQDPNSPEDRALFDELVEINLRGWINERRRVITEGKGKNSQTEAQKAKVRAGRK